MKQPSQEWRVSIRRAVIWRSAPGNEACGICEDQVIDVGVLHGTIGILPSTVDQESHSKESSGSEHESWAREEGGEGGH